MFFHYIIPVVASILLVSLVIALVLLVRLKRRIGEGMENGMYVQVTPEMGNRLKEALSARFHVAKEIYQTLYMTCDNFPRNRERIGDALIETYSDGSIFGLCNDLVEVTNLCENGAIYRMGRQYKLTPLELRTCCFLYWEFKWQQACTVESLTENAYNVRCSRIRRKLLLEKDERIRDFIIRYCQSGC